MSLYSGFIYFFGILSIFLGIMVITRKNAIHSAVYLIFCILSIAGLFFLLQAEFIAGIQIIVYAGGIMVIYVFTILLIKLEVVKGLKRRWEIKLITAIVFSALSGEILYLLLRKREALLPEEYGIAKGTVQAVGSYLLRDYLIPFEVVSLLLLVAMIGAIMLSRKKV
ncbi:NADH-quinone oxidoreductase subunit J [Candidatus Aminicenantes bacterium AC-708-M15]|jgi:NADH-quinone oxidoreductase subunit J|nr:NADH-quinone oxidoreductase subunit J [SCandidatus Aminicenantes bacterium Aminicenantia_JdfR_composite]MCP2597078.1 NADH-quinone oxidoreductase subunit J [Candidatus Aminicenantes bacterium AC-335-G13]MCP2598992.1 NADH-quinone oxidoreductase subunit J [Candidatus Aminicenantes bacterium AC-335-B20]MCP2604174.1 NADH-quinone oxidoreductase subunit J [Candidatus Aminicenantes bacterium AC-708-M15]MCP2605485.1 NADH-quinone oxidoreductase subunit J [Candidatus Aminicenantes bacterium AC-335-O07]